jgi:DNA-binding response OmpR family regulator
VLIIEDDATLATTLRYSLQQHGFHVTVAADGHAGLKAARAMHPDLIVLDLMLPQLDGRQVCRHLRSWTTVPILMLTALSGEEDLVMGLELGADDYVTKPFSMRALLARIQALLRRAQAQHGEPEALVAGELIVLPQEYRALFHGRALRLPPKEFKLLEVLVRRAGKVCTRMELLDLVWGEEVVVDPRNIDVHIRWLRSQLAGEPDGSWLIETIHGVGYRFAGPLGPPMGDAASEVKAREGIGQP